MFKDATNTQVTNAVTDAWSTLWSVNIPGGSVANQNAVLLVADFAMAGAAGYADCRVLLNGQVVAEFESEGSLELYVWRFGVNIGNASGVVRTAAGQTLISQPITNLQWGNAQTLRIEGISNTLPGCYLMRAGVLR